MPVWQRLCSEKNIFCLFSKKCIFWGRRIFFLHSKARWGRGMGGVRQSRAQKEIKYSSHIAVKQKNSLSPLSFSYCLSLYISLFLSFTFIKLQNHYVPFNKVIHFKLMTCKKCDLLNSFLPNFREYIVFWVRGVSKRRIFNSEWMQFLKNLLNSFFLTNFYNFSETKNKVATHLNKLIYSYLGVLKKLINDVT